MHASPRLLGVASAVSIAVPLPAAGSGTATVQRSFVLGDEWFTIDLTIVGLGGAGGGHQRIDVYRNGERLFFEERGCRRPGAGYSLGSPVFVDGARAYEIVAGRALFEVESGAPLWPHLDPGSYYLLRYDSAVLPQCRKPAPRAPLPWKEFYSRRELLPLRETSWSAGLATSALGAISAAHSEVPGFFLDGLKTDRSRFTANQWLSCLQRTELRIGERTFVFE
ncbi:MAG: hypothetical protein EOO16_20905 [Chitinophagaceae bacterium]|nr:MAG: hypothetical protein EOO16_20905 [Chitinophagaceae bacterium]